MSSFCAFRLTFSFTLLASVAYLILTCSDWWIYSVIVGVSAIINLKPITDCKYWRFIASLVIIFGTLETIFLVWTFNSLGDSPLLNDHHLTTYSISNEGRNIFLIAAASSLAISCRLCSLKINLFDAFRSLLLLGLLSVCVYSASFSFRFFLPDFATHAINAVSAV